MVVTDKFVYIHSPKSGGTFVTEKLLAAAKRSAGFHATDLTGLKHAGARRIPAEYRHLPVVTNLRNTFSHYVSRYHYRWWAVDKHIKRSLDVDRVLQDYPSFPELSFSDYLRFVNHWPYRLVVRPKLRQLLEQYEIGYNTWAFIRLTQRKPVHALKSFENLSHEQLLEQYSDIRFLRTESLNEDLATLLVESDMTRQDVNHIVGSRVILPKPADRKSIKAWLGYLSSQLPLPGQKKNAASKMTWQTLYSQADIDFVLRRDRLILTLFPEMQQSLITDPADTNASSD